MTLKLSRDPLTPIKYCRTKQGFRDKNYCNIFIVVAMDNNYAIELSDFTESTEGIQNI